MRNKYAVFLGVFAVLGFFGFSRAEAAVSNEILFDIGALINSSITGSGYSVPRAISANGSTVVGDFSDSNGDNRVFKYSGSTLVDIGALMPGSISSSSSAVSSNGSVIVGYFNDGTHDLAFRYSGGSTVTNVGALIPGSTNSQLASVSGDGLVSVGYFQKGAYNYAFRYEGSTITDIGAAINSSIAGSTSSYANAVSANGSTTVGFFEGVSTGGRAFKYKGSTLTDIGSLFSSNDSTAVQVSNDGSVVVGYFNNGFYDHAFRYDDSTPTVTLTDIGALISNIAGPADSYTEAVSADGSTVVGYFTSDGTQSNAFKYKDSVVTDIGALLGSDSRARAVSADGSTVVGYFDNGSYRHAFKYKDSVVTDIGALILSGLVDSHANKVSDDGTVTGYFDAGVNLHAFIFKSKMVDITNTSTSLYYNGAQLNSIINARVFLMGNNLNQDCALFGSNNICVGMGARYSGVTAHNTSEEAGVLKVAYKFNPHFRAGVMLDQVFDSEDPSNFVVSNPTPTVVLFTNLAQNAGGYNGYGFNFKLAASYNKSKLSIKRDAYLPNTEEGRGDTSLVSKGILAQFSYNHKIAKRLDVIPSFGIRYSNIVRNGYTESSAVDFPITYKALRQKSTTAIASVGLNLWKSPGFNFSLGGGVEHNLQSSIDGYAGYISQMGSFSLKAASITKTRPFAEAKASYDFTNTQRVTSSVYYGKQQFNNAYATTVYLMYMVGF
jgi:probable HAF family extracellular repeat protein